jgi:hypothetical protein
VTDLLNLQRRRWLAFLSSWSATTICPRAWADAETSSIRLPIRLAATWQGEQSYQVGVLAQRDRSLQIDAALDVPTRAHGVWVERGGTLLAVARRPGDWLLRWRPGSPTADWAWIEADRAFNGHAIVSRDGKMLYTTETDLETGQGLIGLRDVASLEKTGEISTHGMDPHELLLDTDGSLVVANGGIPALPETGRLKIHMERMDSSLVRLDTRSGELLGQWRLDDRRLSLRHIAWTPTPAAANPADQRLLGIALQAEHDELGTRLAAPVLAVFDGHGLRSFAAGPGRSLAGYGGDVAGVPGGFAVSCPRVNGVATWRGDGQWAGFFALDEACALTVASSRLWAGGRTTAVRRGDDGKTLSSSLEGVRLDNHWMPTT